MLCRDSRQSFLFYADNVPRECCSFGKFFLILYCRNCGYKCRFSADIFTKVFFAVLCRKSDSFTKAKGYTNSTHFLCSYVATHSLCVYPILSKCGALYRLFLLGFCQNLLHSKREINSTLSLFIYPTILELYGFERQFIINSKHKQL